MWHGDQLDEWLMQASQMLHLVEAPGSTDAATVLVMALALPGDLEPEPEWTMRQLVECWVNPPTEYAIPLAFHD